ncbi:MAG: transketolase [Candidatus Humimicrobiaceae bacterium]
MIENNQEFITKIEEAARIVRKDILCLGLKAGEKGAHIGPGLSIVEILAALYMGVMDYDSKNPAWPDRDRFILSKGHGVLGLYAVLTEVGILPFNILKSFYSEDSILAGHPSLNVEIGIEASTGSLGHGLSMGVGLALSAKMDKNDFNTYVLVGNGECNEGTIWEALMAASKYKLNNLTIIIDHNRFQADGLSSEIMDIEPLKDKLVSFGCFVREVDGHNIGDLLGVLNKNNKSKDRPNAIIAHTVKGKGISFCENNKSYHHTRNFNKELTGKALKELGFCEKDIW